MDELHKRFGCFFRVDAPSLCGRGIYLRTYEATENAAKTTAVHPSVLACARGPLPCTPISASGAERAGFYLCTTEQNNRNEASLGARHRRLAFFITGLRWMCLPTVGRSRYVRYSK